VPDPHFATNLRRLIHFEHRSGKEAAAALGVTEATISRWITGHRYPSAQALIKIDRLYGISPRDLDSDPIEFAQRLADPERMRAVQAAMEGAQVIPFTAAEVERAKAAVSDDVDPRDDWVAKARREHVKKVEERVQKRQGASAKRRGDKK